MKVYIILGTTGRSIFDIKESLAIVVKKPIELKTTDNPNFSSSTFRFEVESPQEAKQLIDKAFKWLTKQSWYFDDNALSFSTSGLVDDEGDDWYCEECGEDIDGCECLNVKEKVC